MYCTLILPYINYGVLIWENTFETYLDKIIELQKMGDQNDIEQSLLMSQLYAPLFKKYNILNVHDTFKLDLGTFMFKHKVNELLKTFSSYFTKHVQTHNYSIQEMPTIIAYTKQRKVFLTLLFET